ncbi:MAG TPA: potassium channel family protein [Solirubrobacteraceae bacterium]|nr:potassium channel family protein [Solirubrobacteraceae bacterium]
MDHSFDPSMKATQPLGSSAPAAADRTRQRARSRRGRQRYGLVLLAIMAAFFLQGIANPGPWEQVFVTGLLALTLLLALWAAEAKPALIRLAFAIAALLLVASLAEAIAGDVEGAVPRLANLLLVVLAPPAIVVGVVRSLRAHSGVRVEAVFGVLCLYILVGMAFALVYGAVANFGGKFFAGGVATTSARCLYFSFTTLTTVGYGDFTAATNLGHTLAVMEALIGQIYLVTIVSVLVSNLRPRRATATP